MSEDSFEAWRSAAAQASTPQIPPAATLALNAVIEGKRLARWQTLGSVSWAVTGLGVVAVWGLALGVWWQARAIAELTAQLTFGASP